MLSGFFDGQSNPQLEQLPEHPSMFSFFAIAFSFHI